MKKLYVVGIGPGDKKYRSVEAQEVLRQADVICGYNLYVDLVADLHQGKKLISTGMTKEIDRCVMALEEANTGNVVAMVCSGDSSVYGMTGLIYQLSPQFPEVEIQVVAGITAALSGGSLLGAPLSGDFVVVSLSDLLTPLPLMEKRLEAAGIGDFVTVIYNPSSKKRGDYLKNACEILLKYKKKDTVCGYVQHIGREGECCKILSLEELQHTSLDMFSTVFVGSEQTEIIGGKMVTSRGYELKYDLKGGSLC